MIFLHIKEDIMSVETNVYITNYSLSIISKKIAMQNFIDLNQRLSSRDKFKGLFFSP